MFPMLDRLEVSYCPKLRLKPCPPKCHQFVINKSDQVISSPKCHQFVINKSDQVISSLEEVQTTSHRCNSTPTTTRLDISASQHDSFRLFHHFPALQELEFSFCRNLTSLPEGIQQLSSLQLLELKYCRSIAALPEWLSDISSLKKLVIRECDSIKSLAARIQLLNNLEQLVIAGNQELQQWCESEENKAKLAHINIISL
uniref:Uncharacterized protein n=1 Tax=Setaria viridis TaxID=4556 RepID=A0A4V6D3L7_SETVI|nr:hypothetical protein SEVIR_8G249730v2 [Setaria viridis]